MKRIFTSIIPLLFTLVGCLVGAGGATAQQIKKLSLQGFLKDANGKAIADGTQSIVFRLYPVATGGTAEWTDTQNIQVYGGVYSTTLGSSTNPLDNLDWNTKTYYVGVTVQNAELTPRTELTYAPYSLGSPKAQEVICSGALGDVKFSNLNPTQFAAANGDCWVPMDGRALATTDRLRLLTGLTTLPNGSGMFLRSQEFDNNPATTDPDRTPTSPIATLQDQAMLSHTHPTTVAPNVHNHNNAILNFNFNLSNNWIDGYATSGYTNQGLETSEAPDHTHTATVGSTGGSETRPKNLNAWLYIRIN